MPLAIGTRLGAYEILSALGAGGMGEVYRARDPKLHREVAIKVLPAAFADDPGRLARFQREAHVLASLNHPHIAAIYGLEEPAGTTPAFLVMELVEGEDLSQRIARGSIPLDEALPIAKQIAEALEAAHEQGIIHRDLKPANIKVRPDGTVKVLDFGLAKAMEPVGSTPNVSQSPTITTPAMMTGVGVILGTAAYMSPEQAKGRDADKRSDIWAFGCVLYEMLTGARAFTGEDVADTLASVLKSEPDWNAVGGDVPPAIRTLVERCLVKDRRERISEMAVAQFILTQRRNLDPERSAIRQVPAAPKTLFKRVVPIAAAVLLTALVAGAVAWRLRSPAAPSAPLIRFAFSLPADQQFSGQVRRMVAISPDGTQLVYVANNRLYRRPIGELEAHAIPGTELAGISNPAFSPDGAMVAFYTALDGTLKSIPVGGGTPATLTRASNPFGISWNENGIVFGRGPDGISRVAAKGGTAEPIVSLRAGEAADGPQILPGGEQILFTLATGAGVDRWLKAKIVVQSLKSGERKTIIDGGSDARYLRSGHLVYAVSGVVFAVGFDPVTLTKRGTEVQIIAGVRRSVPAAASGTAQFAVSETGSLIYVRGPANATVNLRTLVRSDRNGVRVPLNLPPRNYTHPRVSRDGKRLAVGVEDGPEANIWIYDLAGTSTLRRLTTEGRNQFPVWSGDGVQVAFQSDRQGDPGIFSQRADGNGGVERLTTPAPGAAHVPEAYSPDGKHLLFTEQRGPDYFLFSLSIDEKTSVPFGNVRSTRLTGAGFSPDGRWVAYSVNADGGIFSPNAGVIIQPFPATGATHPVPKTRIDFHPVWSLVGEEIFYVPAAALPFSAVKVRTQPSVTFGDPVALPTSVPRPGMVAGDMRGYDLLPDGRILSLVPVADQDESGNAPGPEIRVFLNWFDELKRQVPVNNRDDRR